MPDLVQSDAPPYVPPGRPVPRFVAGIVVVALVLVALAVVGPFRVRLDVEVSQWQVQGDRADARATITNNGRFTVRVSTFGGAGLREPAPLRSVEGSPLGSIEIDPGDSVVVTAIIVPDCTSVGGPSGPPLEVDAEVWFGLGRDVDVGGDSLWSLADTVCNPTP